MCVVLILISASIILETLPATGASSELLRTPTPALASVCIQLVPLKIRLTCATILCTILLRCASLIAVILKLMLTILRSLSSISWYKSSKLSVSTLTKICSLDSDLRYYGNNCWGFHNCKSLPPLGFLVDFVFDLEVFL